MRRPSSLFVRVTLGSTVCLPFASQVASYMEVPALGPPLAYVRLGSCSPAFNARQPAVAAANIASPQLVLVRNA
jgi:hypothetical protein